MTTPKGRKLTEHAQESFRRHGFKEPWDDIDNIMDNPTRMVTQEDGATVYIKRTTGRRRRYDFVVEGQEGLVTGMRGKTRHEMRRTTRFLRNNLAHNYEWEPWP